MTRYLTLDIETRDDYMDKKTMDLGAGWVFKLLFPSTEKYCVLGVAIITHEGHKEYITEFDRLRNIINDHDVIIGHNLSYDLGGLMTIGLADHIKDKRIIDTELLGKLFDSSLHKYDLNGLSSKYLNMNKSNDELVNAVIDADIYPWLKKELTAKKKADKKEEEYTRSVDPKKILKWVKSNMQILQKHCPQVVEEYAIQDVVVTKGLFNYFKHSELYKNILDIAEYYSFVIHITMSYRIRGVRVDLNACRQSVLDVQPIVTDLCDQIYKHAGREFNMRSPIQMAEVFDSLEIHYNSTKAGNGSFTSKWMKKQPHPICQLIAKVRSYMLILDTFIKKVLEMQEKIYDITPDQVDKMAYGMVYPAMNVLRAKTGRFSCTTPNIQQIPKRDEILGPICRKMFVPFEGETWYSLDYSNQEGRIHLHYATLFKCPGAKEYLQEFLDNPQFDMHTKVADLCGIQRSAAKTIYLGLSYGMGGGSTCVALGLPTRWWTPEDREEPILVAGKEGKELLDRYHEMIPYMNKLKEITTKSLKSKGNIKTIGGRKLRPERVLEGKTFKGYYYRALSLLSQGSAADQIIAAMILAYKLHIPVVCVVHDEINISSNNYEDATNLKKCMISAIKFVVPQYVDIGQGENWDDAK